MHSHETTTSSTEGGLTSKSMSRWRDWVNPREVGFLPLLLVAVPIAIVLRLAEAQEVVQFVASGLAIIPLAGLMGKATEHLAHRLGPGIGGLLNATFGNAAELILAMFALFKGLDGVVKASLAGSILGNLLLVFGASILAGGIRHPLQRFNRTAASAGNTMMVLAALGLLMPALFHRLLDDQQLAKVQAVRLEHELSLGVALMLILAYGLTLLFTLVTHKGLFNEPVESQANAHTETIWGVRKAVAVLLVATAFVALMSEMLIGTVEAAGSALGLTHVFMGVIVVAIVGNAAEHSSAVLVAMKNQMDLAVGIAMGSALQIALFVAPVLVFVSYLRSEPLDLVFTTIEIVSVMLSVLIAWMVAHDGESNWLEGAMLLLLYFILAIVFYELPEARELVNSSATSTSLAPSTH